MISAPPAIFGAPIPFPYQITLTLPEGASQVRLNLIGPGGYGSLDYGPSLIAGLVLTSIIQFALPMFFLTKGNGIDSTTSLTELILNKPGVWLKTLAEGVQIISAALGTETNDLGVEASLASLFATIVENILLTPLQQFSPELYEWCTEQFSKEEIEDGIPFFGWIIRAVAVAGTVADMAATVAEIATNPVTISNTVSFTNSVTVVVSHDPDDFEFPLDATHFQVQITAGTTALEPPSCGTGSGLCDLGNVTVWLPGGMIGYSWLANSPTIRDCITGAQGQLYNFQNLSLKNDPNPARKTPGCGFPGAIPITYEQTTPVGSTGNHFYLDPVRISDLDPEYHLRRIILDNTTPITVNTNESWGRFRIQIDRMAVYSKGTVPRVVGISTRFHKLAILEIPAAAYIGDDFSNNAKVMSGMGESNDGLLLNPRALTIADSGAVLILQGGNTQSIKAFDFDGKPWKFFKGGTVSVLPARTRRR